MLILFYPLNGFFKTKKKTKMLTEKIEVAFTNFKVPVDVNLG